MALQGCGSAPQPAYRYPRGEGKLRVCGKGGAEGDEFMIGHALQMLRQQGHNGDPSTVLIIGDRYDTDVRPSRP